MKKRIAIVTGAGNGMGKDFAKNMDELGLDEIWAFALHKEGLENLKSEMKTKVICFAMDLSNLSNIDEIQNNLLLQKPKIEWLVNAAGFGKFDYYENITTETSLNMIDLNCKAMVKLTDVCVPFMDKGSRIVDFASVAGFQPVPYGNIYSATKAFVLSYSRALNFELKHKGISVTCVCPYWTKTKFFDRAVNKKNEVVKKYVVMYSSEKVARKAFVDATKRKKLSMFGFVSKAQVFLTKLLPASFVQKVWLKQQKIKYKEN